MVPRFDPEARPTLAGFFPQGKASRGRDAKSGVQDVMARTQLILPQADAACGRPFYSDHRTADGDRIALEIWHRATGHLREGYRLAVFRCRRCGGYHIRQKPIELKAPVEGNLHQTGERECSDRREARPGGGELDLTHRNDRDQSLAFCRVWEKAPHPP